MKTGRYHHREAYRCNKHVAQEKPEGTTIHERRCYSEEETGTDDTTNTGSKGQPGWWSGKEGYIPDHSDMAVLQLANQGGVNFG